MLLNQMLKQREFLRKNLNKFPKDFENLKELVNENIGILDYKTCNAYSIFSSIENLTQCETN